MADPVEILVSGLSQGAVYCVFAIGLSLVYGTSRVLNFAHGSLYTVAGYIVWSLAGGYVQLPLPIVSAVVLLAMFALGACLERTIVRPLRTQANWKTATMMATLGLAFVLDNAVLLVFGPISRSVAPVAEGGWQIGSTVVPLQTIVVFVVAIAVVVALQFFLTFSRIGRAMRAVSQDMTGAAIVGIDANRIFAVSFGLSAALAGIAAILLAPTYLVSPLGGWPPFLKAFVIVVFGGLGSTQGVLYASFILALVEALVISQLGASWTMAIWFVVLLAVLMVRPRGLLGVWGD